MNKAEAAKKSVGVPLAEYNEPGAIEKMKQLIGDLDERDFLGMQNAVAIFKMIHGLLLPSLTTGRADAAVSTDRARASPLRSGRA